MTPIGLFFILALLLSLFFSYKYTVLLLLISCVFQISSVFKSTLIQPYLIAEAFIVFRSLLSIIKNGFLKGKISTSIFLFALWAIIISYVGPNLFDGFKVVNKNLDESYALGLDTLHFGKNNINQILYVILNFTALTSIYLNRGRLKAEDVQHYFVIVVSLAVILGYWEYSSKLLGVPFPTDFFFNGGELYEIQVGDRFRMSSVCGEASFFGAFISSAFWALLFMGRSTYRRILLVLVLGCVILNLSGSGYTTFAAGALLYMILQKVSPKLYISFACLILLFLLFLLTTDIGQFTLDFLQDKQSSGSTDVRSWSAMTNIGLFFDSYGLGIGLGSTRSSSFIVDLLTCTGIIGLLLFISIYKKLIWPLRKNEISQFAFVYCTLLLICMSLSVPDLSFCLFWFGLYNAALLSKRKFTTKPIKK